MCVLSLILTDLARHCAGSGRRPRHAGWRARTPGITSTPGHAIVQQLGIKYSPCRDQQDRSKMPCPDPSLGKRRTISIIPGKRPLRASAGKFVSTISPTRSCIRCSSMAKKSTISTTGRQGGKGDRRGPRKARKRGPEKPGKGSPEKEARKRGQAACPAE